MNAALPPDPKKTHRQENPSGGQSGAYDGWAPRYVFHFPAYPFPDLAHLCESLRRGDRARSRCDTAPGRLGEPSLPSGRRPTREPRDRKSAKGGLADVAGELFDVVGDFVVFEGTGEPAYEIVDVGLGFTAGRIEID